MSDERQYAEVFAKLKSVVRRGNYWEAYCPSHEANHKKRHRRSLTVRIGNRGDLLLKCHRGCTFQEILAALGISREDVYLLDGVQASKVKKRGKRKDAGEKPMGRIVKTWDYEDEKGAFLFQVCRMEPKAFCQRRRKADGDWDWGLGETRRVLYRLKALHESRASGRGVLIAEGEKDVDRLTDLGLVATTNPMGSLKWRPEYSESLRGRHCTVLFDIDPVDKVRGFRVGERHGVMVADALLGVAASARLLRLPRLGNLPEEGWDVSDWLDAGGTREQLTSLIRSQPEHAKREGSDDVRTLLESLAEKAAVLSPGDWCYVAEGMIRDLREKSR